MTQKTRYIVFMLAATVFNIIVTVICFFVLWLIYMALLVPHIPAESAFVGLPVLFVAALVLSVVIYQRALKVFLKKWPFPGLKGPPPHNQ
ncbi:hypothetical protein AGMMS50230_17680 [Spirochaetia bacterium]|nr:hypothetical protein AGMMS50230_17680 [Spirochaetia bacterium]